MPDRAFYVLTYDIANDRRRLKIARLLERYGERVQYSVFEMWLTPEEWQKIHRQLQRLLEESEDSLRVYRLCAACRQRILTLGQGETLEAPGIVVVV